MRPPEFASHCRSRAVLRLAAAGLIFGAGLPLASAHGDMHDRIRAVSRDIGAAPGNPTNWLVRADLNRQHGDFDSALSDLAQADRLKPAWLSAGLQRSRILFDQSRFSAAGDAAAACLKLDPENPDALVLLARCRARLGQTNAAIDGLSRVLAGSAVSQPDLYLERARLQAGCGQWVEAIRGLDDGMAKLGATPSLALPAMDYECARGNYAGALRRVDDARQFLPGDVLLKLRAAVMAKAGRQQGGGKDTSQP